MEKRQTMIWFDLIFCVLTPLLSTTLGLSSFYFGEESGVPWENQRPSIGKLMFPESEHGSRVHLQEQGLNWQPECWLASDYSNYYLDHLATKAPGQKNEIKQISLFFQYPFLLEYNIIKYTCKWSYLTNVWLCKSHTAMLPSLQQLKHTLESGLIARA